MIVFLKTINMLHTDFAELSNYVNFLYGMKCNEGVTNESNSRSDNWDKVIENREVKIEEDSL